ncbi:MAG: G5 domain-containing protein [Clostridiaceae bacterium]|nr:G5 domain-containing protein [Clostridiaceae bacterium]
MLEKLKGDFKNYFSNAPKAAFIVILFSLCVSVTIINAKKTIVVVIDGKRTQITTFRSSLNSVLRDSNIQVTQKDRVMPRIENPIENGDKIYIKKAVDVSVDVDGQEIKLKSSEKNISEMLKAEKIILNKNDKISPSEDKELQDGLKIAITRVDEKVESKIQYLDYTTVMKNDDSLEKGTTKTIQDGTTGSKVLSYKVNYENGKEISRNLVEETVTQKPVDKIVAVGTLGVVNSNRGEKLLYTNSIKVRATAYSANFSSTGKNPGDLAFGITSTGKRAKRTVSGFSSIAVDPRVIPLGTKLYIPGYGCAIAEDVGGAIKGNSIDVYFDTDSEALKWGVKSISVYILK